VPRSRGLAGSGKGALRRASACGSTSRASCHKHRKREVGSRGQTPRSASLRGGTHPPCRDTNASYSFAARASASDGRPRARQGSRSARDSGPPRRDLADRERDSPRARRRHNGRARRCASEGFRARRSICRMSTVSQSRPRHRRGRGRATVRAVGRGRGGQTLPFGCEPSSR
jgi:hypothetical protein